MKMIEFKNIGILLFLVLSLFISCEDDGGSSSIDIVEGVVPNLTKVADTELFIDIFAIQNGDVSILEFDVDIAQGSSLSTDILGYYKKSTSNDVFSAVLFNDVTLPDTFIITSDEVITVFDELNSNDDFDIGDILTISTQSTINNGIILPIFNGDGTANVSNNILTTPLFNVSIDYPVSCPSDIGGSYTFTSTEVFINIDQDVIENPLSNFTYDIVLTDNGRGNYTISDASFGVYLIWSDLFGIDSESPITGLMEFCGNLSGTEIGPLREEISYSGVVNNDGTINVKWESDLGDFAEGVLTPN